MTQETHASEGSKNLAGRILVACLAPLIGLFIAQQFVLAAILGTVTQGTADAYFSAKQPEKAGIAAQLLAALVLAMQIVLLAKLFA